MAALASLFVLPSTASELQRFEAVEPHMGTLVRITVYAPDLPAARTAIASGFARIRSLNETLSDYTADSELSRLTTVAVNRAVPVSDDLFRVLAAAQRLAVATDGAFDITLGPLTQLWREARRTGVPPSEAARAAAAARTGFRALHLDPKARTVRVDRPGMRLDVGAIGKGYAASEALAAITRGGTSSALVAISGDLAMSGAPPGRSGWRVGLHGLDPSVTAVPQTIELTHAAVSTSGNAAQHLDVAGTRYSHILDPATAAGLTDDLTVTVIAPHGLEADGLDTAAAVLGLSRGLALVEQQPAAAALFVHRVGARTEVQASTRLTALIAAANGSASR